MRLRLASSLLVSIALLACQRTPEEPAPVTTATVAPLRSDAPPAATFNPAPPPEASVARCVRALPPNAPPAPPSPDPRCPPDPEKPPKLPVVTLTFPDAKKQTIKAELTRTEAESARGLMFRKSLADDAGMLFRLGDRSDHAFWMRNTCIALDMMFLDDDGLIVGIVENAPTLNDTPRSVGCPSSWVLEVNGGWSRKHGVAPGQRVAIPDEARR